MKKLFLKTLAAFAFLVLTLFCAEGLIRVSYWIVNDPAAEAGARYLHSAYANAYRQWNNGPKDDPFLPPYVVFGNRGYSNPARLKEISQRAKLPPGRTVESYDFLRFDEPPESTRYLVHTNALGFRGAERAVTKPKGTYRIVVLGSYQAFGLGVNDEDTYSYQLEELLNRRHLPGRRFEVWNGGRPAGTAIVGLARLENEILSYQPDLIVLDYGFIDAQTFDDEAFSGAMHFPHGFIGFTIRSVLMPGLAILEHSFLAGRIGLALSMSRYKKNVALFQGTMLRATQFCHDHAIPVVMLNQLAIPSIPAYLTPVPQLRVFDEFTRHPPTPEQSKESATKGWVRHLNPAALYSLTFAFYPYRLNAFQLSRLGHGIVAEALAQQVQNFIQKKSSH